jgi:DNA polymerase-3 subunit epsilon
MTRIVFGTYSFDYQILALNFSVWDMILIKTLCTIGYQKIVPKQASYSLGKLVRALEFPILDRHRAGKRCVIPL